MFRGYAVVAVAAAEQMFAVKLKEQKGCTW
jgi:hypothetical protein